MEHDRFSKDLSEALLKIKKFESQYGVKVVSVDEPLDVDPAIQRYSLVVHSAICHRKYRTFKYLCKNHQRDKKGASGRTVCE